MITDIAPIDLILQRAGRLHRHHRGDGENLRPELLRQARLVITGVSQWERDAPPQFATGVDKVYQPYLLMRSLAVLDVEPGVSRRLNIPGDIPRLVQTVYGKKLICPDHGRIVIMGSVPRRPSWKTRELTANMRPDDSGFSSRSHRDIPSISTVGSMPR